LLSIIQVFISKALSWTSKRLALYRLAQWDIICWWSWQKRHPVSSLRAKIDKNCLNKISCISRWKLFIPDLIALEMSKWKFCINVTFFEWIRTTLSVFYAYSSPLVSLLLFLTSFWSHQQSQKITLMSGKHSEMFYFWYFQYFERTFKNEEDLYISVLN